MKNWKKLGIFFLTVVTLCRVLDNKVFHGLNDKLEQESLNMLLLERWFTLRDKEIPLSRYIESIGCNRVAIYGMGQYGNHLYEELRKTNLTLIGIDRANIYNNFQIPIRKPEDDLSDIDLIIVTPYLQYKEIAENLRQRYAGKMMSLEELIAECETYLYE